MTTANDIINALKRTEFFEFIRTVRKYQDDQDEWNASQVRWFIENGHLEEEMEQHGWTSSSFIKEFRKHFKYSREKDWTTFEGGMPLYKRKATSE